MSAARKILDEPTAVVDPAEIPEAPGMGPTAPDAGYGAVGPGSGIVRCRCGHALGDHRTTDARACLDDDCDCVELRPHRYAPAAVPKRKPYGSREQSKRRHAAIVEAYVGGATSTTLAVEYGLTREAICVVLRRAGVIRRPGPRRPERGGA